MFKPMTVLASILATPIGRQPIRPLVGYRGSITAISLRPRDGALYLREKLLAPYELPFVIACSALAKLRWAVIVQGRASMQSRMHVSCRAERIDQHFPRVPRRPWLLSPTHANHHISLDATARLGQRASFGLLPLLETII